MNWRPLLYRSPSRQPRQAIASPQYLNLKCVSRLRATLYKGDVSYSNGFTVVVVGFWCATNGNISFCEEEL